MSTSRLPGLPPGARTFSLTTQPVGPQNSLEKGCISLFSLHMYTAKTLPKVPLKSGQHNLELMNGPGHGLLTSTPGVGSMSCRLTQTQEGWKGLLNLSFSPVSFPQPHSQLFGLYHGCKRPGWEPHMTSKELILHTFFCFWQFRPC